MARSSTPPPPRHSRSSPPPPPETLAPPTPATGEELAQEPVSSREDVDRAVAAARKAFATWSKTTPAERQAALLKLADVIEEHADELADLEARNAGKPLQAFKDDEIPFMADN